MSDEEVTAARKSAYIYGPTPPSKADSEQVRQFVESLVRVAMIKPECSGCGRFPAELTEYQQISTGSNLSPDDYVKSEEGTYNPRNGHFLCTHCYILAGQPSEKYGWVAP